MHKAFVMFALLGFSAAATYAQGTIQFLNSALSRLQYQEVPGGPINTAVPAGTHVGAYWGTDAAGAAAITGMGKGSLAGPTSLTAAGGIWPAPGSPGGAVYPVNGTQEGQRVWLKIAAWIGGDAQSPTGNVLVYGESVVVSVLLGPTAGPGTVVWQSAAGTATDRAKPFVLGIIPEPSVWTLCILGLVALYVFGAKSFRLKSQPTDKRLRIRRNQI
jgi:hypothetical protein